jgi:oligopeptide transport system substrate-binding protein
MAKRMKYCFFVIFLAIASCNSEEIVTDSSDSIQFKDGLVMTYNRDIESINPKRVILIAQANVANQVYEGLLRYDQKEQKIVNGLAKEHGMINDQTYYFIIRDNVMFHDHKLFKNDNQRKLKAIDVIKTYEYFCTKDNKANSSYPMIFKGEVKGADDFYNGKSKSISGITHNADTVFIELNETNINFLNKLTLESSYIMSGHILELSGAEYNVGTGPFVLTENNGQEISLIANKEYYRSDENGNKLPFLKRVRLIHTDYIDSLLGDFANGDIDLIYELPIKDENYLLKTHVDRFTGIPSDYEMEASGVVVNFFEFNLTKYPFSNKNFRKAIAHCLDKEDLIKHVYNNNSINPGNYGITPQSKSFLDAGFDFKSVKDKSSTYNPDMAVDFFNKSGVDKDFVLKLEYDNRKNSDLMAQYMADQIEEVLGISTEIEGVFHGKTEKEANAELNFYIKGWIPDYHSPETFLNCYYGPMTPASIDVPSPINTSRFMNPDFDNNFEAALKEKDLKTRMQYYSNCDEIFADELPAIVLMYKKGTYLCHSYVRGVYPNMLNRLDLSTITLVKWTKEEWEATHVTKNKDLAN